jgi:FMN-dependent NADH-azoreductase
MHTILDAADYRRNDMQLFRLDSSIRTEGSTSRALADSAERAWLAEHEGGVVLRRDLGSNPLITDAWTTVARAVVEQSDPPAEGLALIDELGAELLASDAFLFAIPMYNWSIPAQVKQWIDLMIAHPRIGVHGDRPLAGKPAILTLSRGGGYGPGSPKEGWDYATPYLRRVLGEVFGLDVRVAEAELTHAFWNPDMASLRALAEESLTQGHERATHYGKNVARMVNV